MRKLALALLIPTLAFAQQPVEPTPAFAGQTDAPAPAKPSSGFKVATITDKLTGPWAMAQLPNGNFLVTERPGTMRIVTPDGKVSEPLANVPAIKRVAAEGLHDVVLDPDFATNRLVYFIYFAPPKGEAAKEWPIEHFYEEVWTKSLAERRTLELGTERIGRARLSNDERSLENVEVLYEPGVERRLAFAPDGTLFGIGADQFRFYDSELDGVEGRDFQDEPDITRNFTGRIVRINKDGTIPKDNPWLSRAT
ncbi:MAG: PQQ-dependent sugar dehydrogenase, partial [Pseudomonadota bacterium]